MPEIDFETVTKVYGDGAPAVDRLDLHVGEGEFMVLVGPSGCGKTTALRMLAGLEEISSGTLRIGGTVMNNVLPKDRDVAMVFQNYALYPNMSVAKNMGFALRARGESKDEIKRKVSEAASILHLTDYLDRRPKALSGGQRQRVAMGRAIVRSPRVFLMDEPLSNLDAKLRVEMRLEIARIQRMIGVATVYVTHDQVEAMTMGDRVAVMRDGKLQQVDTPQRIYDHPANEFVAGFMGSPPMNLIRTRIAFEGGRVLVDIGSQRVELAASYAASHDLSEGQVVLGVRPEDLTIVSPSESNALRVKVVRCEALGAEILVHAAHDEASANGLSPTIVARMPPRSAVQAGDELGFSFTPEHGHFFHFESGATLRRKAP